MNGKRPVAAPLWYLGISAVLAFPLAAMADMHDMMRPRVAPEHLAEAQALQNPLPASAEVVAAGKALYRGKGTCVNCHGPEGAGDGPVAAALNPSPRNFQHHGFWRHRTDGEVFWVVKHGSTGTSMIGFGDQLTDEEIWSIIRYEQTFSAEHGGHHGMPGGGMGGHGGMGGQGRMGMGPE
ncbi:MAG: c-type cytochrome [Nitrospiraceae bacterium]|nr:c-type cytochrome [Nitrospiraceae bacterium]